MDLTVTSGALAAVLAEARRAAPEECCGLLLGQGRRIETAVPAANVAEHRERRFEIDPAALFAAHKAARAGGPNLVGYYHSHPHGPATPSAADRESARGDGRVWVIVADGTISCWRDEAAGFAALSYCVVEG